MLQADLQALQSLFLGAVKSVGVVPLASAFCGAAEAEEVDLDSFSSHLSSDLEELAV